MGASPGREYPPGFRTRRFLNWFPLGLMYASFYMGRYNLSVANAHIREEYGWDKTQFGWIISAGLIVYGLAVLLNGPMADRIGGRKAILLGALGTMTLNVVFGLLGLNFMQPLVAVFAVTYAINMYFQTFGALSVVKVNAAWFHISERGTFAGIFGGMIQFGRVLAYGVGGLIVANLHWKWAFWVPAVVLGGVFVLNFIFVRDTPEELGYPRVDDMLQVEDGEKPAASAILKQIFSNHTLWIIAGAMMCTGLIRHTIEQWGPSYFKEVHNITEESWIYQICFNGQVVVGVAGAMVMGYISDKFFGSRRGPVTAIAYFAQAVLLLLFALIKPGPWAAAVILIVLYFFLNGCHGLLAGTASMDFGGRKAAATAAGLLDGAQYLVGSLVGVGMGKLLEWLGWGAWAWSIAPVALIGGLLMMTRWNVLPKTRGGSAH